VPPDSETQSKTPAPEASSSWTGGAVVASVFVVLLVLVLLHFSQSDVKPLPIVENPTAPPRPPPMDLAPLVASAAPPPMTSAIPLAAIPSAAPMVEVFVMSTPPGAVISRDGHPLGFAPGPITLPVTPDKTTLTVAAGGYVSQELTVTPTPGKTFKVTLKKAPPAQRRAAPKVE
jgi:hypothetical protein